MATVWPLPPVDAADVTPDALRRSDGPRPACTPGTVVLVLVLVVGLAVLVVVDGFVVLVVVVGLVVVVVVRRTVVVVSRPRTPPRPGDFGAAADHTR